MKRILIAAALAATALAFGSAGATQAEGQTKATVCHFNGTDDIVVISIADPAVQSHIDHGDSRPGDAVPGEDATYGENCEIVPNPTGPSPFGIACENLPNTVMGVTGTYLDLGPFQNCALTNLTKDNRAQISNQLLPACFGQGGLGYFISIIDQAAVCTMSTS